MLARMLWCCLRCSCRLSCFVCNLACQLAVLQLQRMSIRMHEATSSVLLQLRPMLQISSCSCCCTHTTVDQKGCPREQRRQRVPTIALHPDIKTSRLMCEQRRPGSAVITSRAVRYPGLVCSGFLPPEYAFNHLRDGMVATRLRPAHRRSPLSALRSLWSHDLANQVRFLISVSDIGVVI